MFMLIEILYREDMDVFQQIYNTKTSAIKFILCKEMFKKCDKYDYMQDICNNKGTVKPVLPPSLVSVFFARFQCLLNVSAPLRSLVCAFGERFTSQSMVCIIRNKNQVQ